MRRDGQFYLIDAFFAAAIVFIGIGFLVSDYVSTPQGTQARTAALDITSLLFDQPMIEINHPYIRANSDVLDLSLPPMGQIQVWQEDSSCMSVCQVQSQELIEALVSDLLPTQHGMEILIDGDSIFEIERPNPVLLINTRRMLYTLYEDELHGPQLVEVRIWV